MRIVYGQSGEQCSLWLLLKEATINRRRLCCATQTLGGQPISCRRGCRDELAAAANYDNFAAFRYSSRGRIGVIVDGKSCCSLFAFAFILVDETQTDEKTDRQE